ncbi:MAG TPA: Mth938-like domain-containing protein, partial [Dietzia sp.]|nr:Mth938-like domain-containing protein [Dietzia sp.]
AGGFQFGGMSHRGSILAPPAGIRIWAASMPADITPETLAALTAGRHRQLPGRAAELDGLPRRGMVARLPELLGLLLRAEGTVARR